MLQKIIIFLTITGALLLSGCKDNREETGYFDTTYHTAEREFARFIEYYIPEIRQILKGHGMHHREDSLIPEEEIIQWHVYRQPDQEKSQDLILATVTIHGEQRLYGMRLPEYIYLGFVYKNGQWCVMPENESFVSHTFSLTDMTSHVYEDLREIFPMDRESMDRESMGRSL
ncbi:MAG: hypothetical protein E3K32_08425 [wastewater metagenome]|nr:hypothetical protein [Candidatus Loosdrechtia aerotolerans]